MSLLLNAALTPSGQARSCIRAALTLLGCGLLLSACSDTASDSLSANRAPQVWFTGGPPQLDAGIPRAAYDVRVHWSGADPDGVITHYEYVIDPNPDPQNPVFSLEEIQSPEEFAARGELYFNLRAGVRVDLDTLDYSKDVPGQGTISFTYIPTALYQTRLALAADKPDSSGLTERKDQAARNHRLYLRAMDNEGLYSEAAMLEFTAVTIVPSAHIKFPNTRHVGDAGLVLGPSIRIAWTGVDIDQTADEKQPIAYLYKLIDFTAMNLPNFTSVEPDFVFTRVSGVQAVPWEYQAADTLNVLYKLADGHSYMFAVRAVDEAGAVQETYSLGGYAQQPTGNVVKFSATPYTGRPILTLSEPTLGQISGTGDFIEQIVVPPGSPLYFTMSADAALYGGVIDGFSYGVDIQNLDLEDGPQSQWSSWSLIPTMEPVVFYEENSDHILYVRTRDTAGTVTMGVLLVHVADFNFDRQVLVVDDFQDTNWPLHWQHTDFWIDALDESGRFNGEDLKPEILFHRVWGPEDRLSHPLVPNIGKMGQYRMIFWNLNRGNGVSTAMMSAGPQTRHLTAYVNGGGKLLVAGQSTMLSLMPNGGTPAEVLNELKPNGGPSSFAFRTMHLYGTIDNGKLDDDDRLVRVEPFPGKEEIWPALNIDRYKISRAGTRGVPYCESILEGLFTSADPEWFPELRGESGIVRRGERLDTLYVYRARTAFDEGRHSKYDYGVNALRYSDSRETRRKQHRTVWFGFPLYYLQSDDAATAVQNIVDWFREEEVLPHETP